MESHSSSWSIGETRALAVKAARGSGMPWGMAEEAGYACAWLENHCLPGVTALSALLNHRCDNLSGLPALVTKLNLETASASNLNDQAEGGNQLARQLSQLPTQQVYCPVLLGTLISDGLISNSVGLVPVAQPILLLPFLAMAARSPYVNESRDSGTARKAVSVGLNWKLADDSENCRLRAISGGDYTRCHIESDSQPDCVAAATCEWDLQAEQVENVETTKKNTDCTRVGIDEASGIAILELFASFTYAPETEDSRNKGAGADDEN